MDIDKFLAMRNERIIEIEIGSKLHIKIGESLCSERAAFNDDAYTDGCIYQFFAYIQRILARSIFNDFCAIIGNYDKKRDCFTSWEKFALSTEHLSLLKTIKKRYSGIRNDRIAHLSGNANLENDNISYSQVEEDISHLRDILNFVRKLHNIPVLSQPYDASNQYAVQGIQKLLQQFLNLDTNNFLLEKTTEFL